MGSHDELPPPGPLSTFPAPGLRDIQRNVTTHDENGVGVFLPADNGDHQSVMVNGGALANILYQTDGWPVDMNGDKDVKWAEATEPGLMSPNGSLVRIIDFAPNIASPPHRALTLGYGCVLEGVLEFELDSGEIRTMRRGDVSVNRATIHTWRNVTPLDEQGGMARMLYVLLPIEPLKVGRHGREVQQELGYLAKSYPVDYPEDEKDK